MRLTTKSAALIALLSTGPAAACGGFFCSQVPVDQAGEQILFAVNGNEVTAHIQIAYTGEAEKFSWVLPLPSVPTLGVGTEDVFTFLRQTTDPRFTLQWNWLDGCSAGDECFPSAEDGGFQDGGDDGTEGTDGGGVSVVAEGSVGPFDYKVVESTSGDALFEWLNDNGYDQPESSKPIVGHYVNQEFKFLALRLQKDKSAGDLQPVVISYTSETFACVPLKLTSIAAAPDMPVRTWVLAGARAVPMNFFHVTLNPKAYPWLDCGSWWGGSGVDCAKAYTDMVTEAANAANGHAFVTEYAGPSSIMSGVLFQPGQWNLSPLKGISDPSAYLDALMEQGFPRTSLMQEVIRKWIPKPADASEDCDEDAEFYTWNREACFAQLPDDFVFDPAGMTLDLEQRVVEPAKAAQALFDAHTYLTRVFTTVSPDEMTKDPIFSFNPDLPDVTNQHTTFATPVCAAGESLAKQLKLEYPDGSEETVDITPGQGCSGPILGGSDGGDIAAVSEIQTFDESGTATAVPADEVDAAEAKLELRTPKSGQSKVTQDPAKAGAKDTVSGLFGAPSDAPAPPDNTDGTDATDGADGADGVDGVDGVDGAAGAEGGTSDGGSSGGGSSGCSSSGESTFPGVGLLAFVLAFALRRR